MYKTHTLEEYNLVKDIKIKNPNWGSKKIFIFLYNKGINIKQRTIESWLYTNKKPFEEVIINKIPEVSKILTTEKAYILGVLCGDGYIRIQQHSHGYLVGLNVCDEDFADEFKNCLKKVYELVPSKNLKKMRPTNVCNNPKQQYVINLTSKLVIQDLLKYSPSFKTKEWKIPEQIKNSNLEFKSAFLRGFFDSEGTIRLKKKGHAYLQICSGNNDSLLDLKKLLLDNFNINLKINYNQGKVMMLYSERYKDIKNFSDKIGFTIERKRKVLDICLQSYKRKGLRNYNQEFKIKVLNLLNQGYSAYKIGKMLDFPYTNIYDFIKQEKREIVKE